LLKGGNDYLEPLWVLWMVSGFVFEKSGVVDQSRSHAKDYRWGGGWGLEEMMNDE
jgi:hypothetical protein